MQMSNTFNLNCLRSSRSDVEEFKRKDIPLHILINNAGVFQIPNLTFTEDNLEMQMGVNHFGPFLLTNLLLDKLKESAPSRVIVVSSGNHFGGKIPWDNFDYKNGDYDPFVAYGNTKLANIMFVYELARRLEGTGVTVNAVHPGAVNTEISRHSPINPWIKEKFFRTPYQGALTSLYVAVAPEAANVTGKFWATCGETKSIKSSYNVDAQKKLWNLSAEAVGLEEN